MAQGARYALALLVGALIGGVAAAAWLRRPAPSAAAVGAPAAVLEVVSAGGSRRFTLEELQAAVPAETVSVRSDPSYGRRAKRYLGFPLERVLALGGLRPAPDQVLFFQASDGYRATMADPVEGGPARGFVAFADLDATDGWEKLETGKSPGPFYLVWSSADSSALARPWPYQLVRIEAVDPREKYDRIHPEGVAETDPVYRGYRAFVVEPHGGDQCIACHSLNLQGGGVGPELNVPRNITEYRDEATLIAFIQDAHSFRARTQMPSFRDALSQEQIRDILAYLRWLAGRKVQPDSVGR